MKRLKAWLEIASDPAILRQAGLTAIVVGALLTAINHADDVLGGQLDAAVMLQIALTLLVPFVVSLTSSVAAVQRQRSGQQRNYELLEREVEAINKFPDQNPNPVLRVTEDGRLLYANTASAPVLEAWRTRVGEIVPDALRAELLGAAQGLPVRSLEVTSGWRTFAVLPVPVPEFSFLNLYGTEITAAKVVERFPDRNPNPVMRASPEGRLVYANAASGSLVRGLGLKVGAPLPADLLARLSPAVGAADPKPVEVQGEGRTYELRPVPIPEFGFIHIYGTDITAAREVERAQQESERLLLNILPASIAERLKHGEEVIADRFEEMTVLFADVVGFTPLSQGLSPSQVVVLLNSIFSIFDRLADQYGLEKIKTIGDAYMVVGGLTPESRDHAARMADMALEMIAGVASLPDETGQGVHIRVGVHGGPAVAGVIGLKKFIYDVWGDTVNTASRMESHGVPDRIQVSQSTYERLRGEFEFEPRGTVEIKGKGPLPTYLLVGRRAGESARSAGLRSQRCGAL